MYVEKEKKYHLEPWFFVCKRSAPAADEQPLRFQELLKETPFLKTLQKCCLTAP